MTTEQAESLIDCMHWLIYLSVLLFLIGSGIWFWFFELIKQKERHYEGFLKRMDKLEKNQ